MNEHTEPGPESGPPADDGDDPTLAAAGARLREQTAPIAPTAVEVAALRRRSRRLGGLAAGSLVAALLFGGLAVARGGNDDGGTTTAGGASTADGGPKVDQVIAGLARQPIDPTKVKLVSSVSTFADCDALIGDLRRVGAEHVGSRGFGAFFGIPYGAVADREAYSETAGASPAGGQALPRTGPADESTLGTNVQVEGVDELDHVKAVGTLIYDFDGRGNLRITDGTSLAVLSTLDVTPGADDQESPPGAMPRMYRSVDQLLVADGRAVVFGTEVETSAPVKGDPSATQASTSYLTVTSVDVSDPAKPAITDRVRVEGSLVSARLVGGQVRLVTTSDMADLGFVLPTTPTSVAKALDRNRRSVAGSSAADWIPDYQRTDEAPKPLVPCDRVHVPDTFAGVAMTSMVTFPLAADRFEPVGTSILAPATTLYSGVDKVAISSEVWVDPVDRDRLKFDDWKTAVHEFTFAGGKGAAPTYEGSGLVDGSTLSQFAFGEVGDSLAVVSADGTPWGQNPSVGVELTLLTPNGKGGMTTTSKLDDLSDGKGAVSAVRFVKDRVLISTGLFGRSLYVVDLTDPAAPRRAGSLTLPSEVGYFHPLADGQALVVGSRNDEVGEGQDRQPRSWVVVQLLDVSDADTPRITGSWERPWSSDQLADDHHAFTYWPTRKLAMWGIQNTQWNQYDQGPNHAVVLGVEGGVNEVAVPVANQPAEAAPPCPTVAITDPEVAKMVGTDNIVLGCADRSTKAVSWPRYQCYRVDDDTAAMYAPGGGKDAAYFVCSPAPPPSVSRVLVVAGRPILLTDQTLEALDPTTFASTSVAYHPQG